MYQDFKLHGHEARVRHLLNPALALKHAQKMNKAVLKREAALMSEKEDIEERSGGGGGEISLQKRAKTEVENVKKMDEEKMEEDNAMEEVLNSNSSSSSSSSSSEALRDVDVFEIPYDKGLIGFKNFTVFGTLRRSLDGSDWSLPAGSQVFVKMGESYDTCLFAKACDDMRFQLGMVAMKSHMAVEWLVPTYNVAELAARTNPSWVQSASKRMEGSMRAHGRADGTMPAIVMSVFEGQEVCHRKEWVTDGMELLKVLLFRKYVGSTDTNGKNIMVNQAGRVFSVDEAAASEEQLVKYSSKGLCTAQKLHSALTYKAAQALSDGPQEVADFIRKLKEIVLPQVIGGSGGGRLAEVHANIPFDEDTVALLNDSPPGSRPLVKLANKLHLC